MRTSLVILPCKADAKRARCTACQALATRTSRLLEDKPCEFRAAYSEAISNYGRHEFIGKAKTLYIHKLVALAFLPCDDPTRRVVHRDNDRSNNRLENLEWVANVKEKKKALDFVLQEELVEKIRQREN